jgi:hypothetical protein
MANFFRNKVINEIGTTPETLLTTTASTRATVIGLSLANLTESNILASIQVEDDDGNVGYYVKDILIPPNTSLRAVNGGEKLILSTENTLTIFCSQPAALDAVMSYVEIA